MDQSERHRWLDQKPSYHGQAKRTVYVQRYGENIMNKNRSMA